MPASRTRLLRDGVVAFFPEFGWLVRETGQRDDELSARQEFYGMASSPSLWWWAAGCDQQPGAS